MLPLPNLKNLISSGRRDLAGLMTMAVTVPAFLLMTGHLNWPLVTAFSLLPGTFILWTVGRATLEDLRSHPAIRLFDGKFQKDTFQLWDGPGRNIGDCFQFQGATLTLTGVPSNEEILRMYQGNEPVAIPKTYFPSFFDSDGAVICFIGSGAQEGAIIRLKSGKGNAWIVASSASEFKQLLAHKLPPTEKA